MKILITTSSNPNSLAAYYTRYLQEVNGIKVIPANTFDIEERYVFKNTAMRIVGRALPWIIAKNSTAHLLERTKLTKPDVIVIIKGMYILPSALRKLKQSGIKLVNYNPDHPIRYDSAGSGNRFVKRALQYYHLMYSYSPEIVGELKALHTKAQIKVLPFGFKFTPYNTTDLSQLKRRNKICFVGIGDVKRCSELSEILHAGFSVDVYGSGYDYLATKFGGKLTIYPATFGNKYHEILQTYDVQLNLFRNQNRNAHNMRTFEIPAVGGIQMSPYSDQCATFFKPDQEIFMYREQESLMTKLEFLLSQSKERNLEFRQAARNKCLIEDYSYAHRARQMVEDLKTL